MLLAFSSLNKHRLIKVILINNRSIQISCEEKVFPQFQESKKSIWGHRARLWVEKTIYYTRKMRPKRKIRHFQGVKLTKCEITGNEQGQFRELRSPNNFRLISLFILGNPLKFIR